MKKILDVKYELKYELYDAFYGDKWFHNVKVNKALLDDVYEIELIVNEYFNMYNLNDVKDELGYLGFKVYDENYFITNTKFDDIYSVKFFVKGVKD